ncbi:hypothetical protein F5H01DRAFT_37205 [Linnemannia elongata]|nr:hypothetical protein F5H01DRAFT_37205 [Linnemannia elongata]
MLPLSLCVHTFFFSSVLFFLAFFRALCLITGSRNGKKEVICNYDKMVFASESHYYFVTIGQTTKKTSQIGQRALAGKCKQTSGVKKKRKRKVMLAFHTSTNAINKQTVNTNNQAKCLNQDPKVLNCKRTYARSRFAHLWRPKPANKNKNKNKKGSFWNSTTCKIQNAFGKMIKLQGSQRKTGQTGKGQKSRAR